jgi:hypothetical protein
MNTNRHRVELNVEQVTIEEAKATYIETEKKTTFREVLEVLGGEPRFFTETKDGRERFAMLGRDDRGRWTVVGLEQVGETTTWRVTTAYHMGREIRARRLYEQE